jgi:hypothetical protein
MTVQTVGRISVGIYCINDFLPRAVMAGGAGTSAVGVNIMYKTLYFRPVGNIMTVATQLAW